VPRTGMTHVLVSSTADAHVQLATTSVQTLTLSPQCTAVMLHARTQHQWVTFDGTNPSSTNGLRIIAGTSGVFVPLGRHAGSPTNDIRALSETGSGFLDILQLA
jgi:hypothetical protein